MQSKKGLLY